FFGLGSGILHRTGGVGGGFAGGGGSVVGGGFGVGRSFLGRGFGVGRGFLGRGSGVGIGLFRSGGDVVGGALGGGSSVGSSLFGGGGVGGRIFLGTVNGVSAGGEGQHAGGGNGDELGVQGCSPERMIEVVRPGTPHGPRRNCAKQDVKKRKAAGRAGGFLDCLAASDLRGRFLGSVLGVLGSVFRSLGRIGSRVSSLRGRGGSGVGSSVGGSVGSGGCVVGGNLGGVGGGGAVGLDSGGCGVGSGVSRVGSGVLGLLLVAAGSQGEAQSQRKQSLVDGHIRLPRLKFGKRAKLRAITMMTSP